MPHRASASSRFAVALAVACVAGCATRPAVPALSVSPEQTASDFSARSLRDPGLHRFLQENLGRDPGDVWDFEALSWTAFYFHPGLELARAQWASARAAEAAAGLRPNPTLTLAPGYNFTREPGLSPWMPSINLDFLFSGAEKRRLEKSVAARDAEAAKLAVFTSAWQVRAELRRALSDVAMASRREAQFRAQLDAQRSLLTLLEQRYTAGAIALPEVSAARSVWLKAQSSVADAQGQSLIARARLAAALGLPVAALEGVTLPAPPNSPALAGESLAAARRQALQSRSDILNALAKFHSAQAVLELELAKQTPDFHLGPGYQWDQGANKWTLALGFELPLFHRNDAQIAAAASRRTEAAAQFNLIQAQAIAAIDLAVAAHQAAQIQLEHARGFRAETEQQNARVQKGLELGAANQVEVLTAKLDLAVADNALLDAENAFAAASGQLEDALQVPFPRLAAILASAGRSAMSHE